MSYQAIYTRRWDGLRVHTIDLHWRLLNPQRFAHVLTFDEIARDAVPIPALGSSARAPSGVHSLFIALVHRVAHHRDDDLLIWLQDIHLVGGRLAADEWAAFVELAVTRDMAAICRQGLARARATFGTAVPPDVDRRLAAGSGRREASTAFLDRRRPQLATLLSDLSALTSWDARARLMREHLVPPAAYMRQVYAPSSRAPLGALYVWRALRGAWRWIARA